MANAKDDDDLAVLSINDEEEMKTLQLTQVPKFQREPSSRSNNPEDLLNVVRKSEKKPSSISLRAKEGCSDLDSSSLKSDTNLEKEVPKREPRKTILKNTKAAEIIVTKRVKKPVKESVESSEGEDDEPVKEKKTVYLKKTNKLSDYTKKTPTKKSETKEKTRTEVKSSKESEKREVKTSSKPKEEPKKVKEKLEKVKKIGSPEAAKSTKPHFKSSSEEGKDKEQKSASKTFKKQNVKAEASDKGQETGVKSVKKLPSSLPKKENERTNPRPIHSPTGSK